MGAFKGIQTGGHADKVSYSNSCYAVIETAKLVTVQSNVFLNRRPGTGLIEIYFAPVDREPRLIGTLCGVGLQLEVRLETNGKELVTTFFGENSESLRVRIEKGSQEMLAKSWGYTKAGTNPVSKMVEVAMATEMLGSVLEQAVLKK
jgi:hypothetical protein